MSDLVKKQVENIRTLLESQKENLKAILPQHMTVDRMLKISVIASARNLKILECTPVSLVNCIINCAQIGLEPNTPLNHAYLIPYKNQLTLQIGYQGLIELARRSGQIQTIYAGVIREKDRYSVQMGTDAKIEHTPYLEGDAGKTLLVYAVAKLADGATQFEVMTIAEVEKIRQTSPGKNSDPWTKHFDEMAKKTVLKRLCKVLPKSTELARAIEMDNEDDGNLANIDFGFEESEAEKTIREAQEKKEAASDAVIEGTKQEELK